MEYLRMITRGKWEQVAKRPQSTERDLQAYTIFYDLSLDKGSKLSVWKVTGDEDVEDALIALASNRINAEEICAVKIDEKKLSSLNFDNEPGDTPTYNINHKHCNIIDLTYAGLDDVIRAVFQEVKARRCIRKNKREVKEMLRKAYQQNKLDIDKMNENLLSSLEISVQ